MHYDIHYTDLPEAEKKAKALADIKEWLGEEKFEKITEAFKAKKYSADVFCNLVSISGVQGYPVMVWYNHCYPDALDWDADSEADHDT